MKRASFSKSTIADALDAMDALQKMVSAYKEYRIVAEQEATKREEIRNRRRLELKHIQLQRELLTRYLERSFDERRESFARLFTLADEALEQGDNAQLGQVLTSITQLAATSPFKSLSDVASARQALLDPEQDWGV
jgi:transposase